MDDGSRRQGLPNDLPSFLCLLRERTRSVATYRLRRRPAGFRCADCGHERAYSHKLRLIEGMRRLR